jgi:hypothetical protein
MSRNTEKHNKRRPNSINQIQLPLNPARTSHLVNAKHFYEYIDKHLSELRQSSQVTFITSPINQSQTSTPPKEST